MTTDTKTPEITAEERERLVDPLCELATSEDEVEWFLRELLAAEQRGAQREHEQCCKDVCHRCKKGDELEQSEAGDWFHKGYVRFNVLCRANAIRQRGDQQ